MLRHFSRFTGAGGAWEKSCECPCHPRKITVFLPPVFSGDGKNPLWTKFPINKETSKNSGGLLLIVK